MIAVVAKSEQDAAAAAERQKENMVEVPDNSGGEVEDDKES